MGIYQQSNQLSKDIRTASNNMEENCWTRDRDRSKGFFAALRVSFIKAREDWVELSKNRAFLFVCVLGVYATIFKANFTRSEKVNSEKLYPSPSPQLHTCSYYYQFKEAFGSSWKVMKSTNAYYNHIVISLYWIRILETLIAPRSKWPNMTDSPKRLLEY